MSTLVSELRKGNIVNYKNALYRIVSNEHVKPGKGGAFCQIEMKGVLNGTKLNERFRSAEKLEKVVFESIKCQFLYRDGDSLELMNNETYEQFSMGLDSVNGDPKFLVDNMEVSVEMANNEPISINLPQQVVLTITETETYFKGQTLKSSFKPATLENGVVVQIPDYIGEGEKIVVATEDSSYVERYKG